ncbi:MAG: hypothetical protein SFX72_23240 [Isosphaeraceae bacterium]|nr:hypothetical protein [Isosphaeraceae bacterium]
MGYRNLKVAAEELGVGYDWLRRAVTQGVSFNRGDKTPLDDLAKFFGVSKDDLWGDPSDRFRKAVLVKAKPDHVKHSVTLEAVLRHYGMDRPALLAKCVDVINHYRDKLANPSIPDPKDRYCLVEASATEPIWPRSTNPEAIDQAVENRLSQIRRLPKREVLEAVVRARIEREQRHDRLSRYRDLANWEATRAEIVAMLVHLLMEERGVGSEADAAALTALAQRYAQRLWDGEFTPGNSSPGGA